MYDDAYNDKRSPRSYNGQQRTLTLIPAKESYRVKQSYDGMHKDGRRNNTRLSHLQHDGKMVLHRMMPIVIAMTEIIVESLQNSTKDGTISQKMNLKQETRTEEYQMFKT